MNRDDKTPADFYCLNCRYSLHALPGNICPECGQTFDLSDPATFATSPRKPLIRMRGVTIVALAATYGSIPLLFSLDHRAGFEVYVMAIILLAVGIGAGISACRQGSSFDRVVGTLIVFCCGGYALMLAVALYFEAFSGR